MFALKNNWFSPQESIYIPWYGRTGVWSRDCQNFGFLLSGFSLPYFTCAVNAVSGISWFACTNVRAFSVVTESIGAAMIPSCLTLVYVCNVVNRMHWLIWKNMYFFIEWFLQSCVFWNLSFVKNHADDYGFLWLRATIKNTNPYMGKLMVCSLCPSLHTHKRDKCSSLYFVY